MSAIILSKEAFPLLFDDWIEDHFLLRLSYHDTAQSNVVCSIVVLIFPPIVPDIFELVSITDARYHESDRYGNESSRGRMKERPERRTTRNNVSYRSWNNARRGNERNVTHGQVWPAR